MVATPLRDLADPVIVLDFPSGRAVAPDPGHVTGEHLGIVLEALPVITYTARTDGDFRPITVSKNIEALTGYSVQDFLTDPTFWIDKIHPDDRDRIVRSAGHARIVGEGTFEYRWQIAAGTYVRFRDTVRVVHRDDGTPSHFVGASVELSHDSALRRLGAAPRTGRRGTSPASVLTPRETETLQHLALGMTKKEIAGVMSVSMKTVEKHTENLMRKLDIHNRVKLARFAIREGLVKL